MVVGEAAAVAVKEQLGLDQRSGWRVQQNGYPDVDSERRNDPASLRCFG